MNAFFHHRYRLLLHGPPRRLGPLRLIGRGVFGLLLFFLSLAAMALPALVGGVMLIYGIGGNRPGQVLAGGLVLGLYGLLLRQCVRLRSSATPAPPPP